jgi:hypothetical protein|tara:strand:- start:21 stop:548 length:528 start_codon:yes stop_codon:yes gene_type:complete
MAQGEPNLEGAIKILVDLLTANGFTMTRSPYENNMRGLVDALIDFKEGFPTFAPLQVGFNATAFQDVTDGDALYMRTSDGQVGKASAADGTIENATVVGFANATVSANNTVKVIVTGLKTLSSLNAGDLFFLSDSTAGGITITPPSGAGKAVTRVGEASTATDLAIHIEPPILLR